MRFQDRAQLRPGCPSPADPKGEIGAPTERARSCAAPSDAPFPCDRCGAAMFRMHSVWRCPSCGFKTDCCGW